MNCNNGYNFKRANYPLLYESLSSIDWTPLQNIDDVEKAYKRYISNTEKSISAHPKKFWAFIQSKKGTTRIPGLMVYDGTELSTPSDIVNAFGEYFNSVFIRSIPRDHTQPPPKLSSSTQIIASPISSQEVL
ncbi:hypothetical protein Zmor_018617 [Zophobas morio]|uniref:Uncharacterized protein n=1 Tax=Zophobas morio TaxID=2755281 RepID=A0AA38MDN3_9CUCU|nr:hypothetical protein Zmor_018617 [Zophobas morio]